MHATMQNKQGMTLIEVLIALAIISIALTAIIKVTGQTIRNTLYLQNKTIAVWVGTDVMNQVLAGVLKLPTGSSTIKNTHTLGQNWTWQATLKPTSNPHIKQIGVDVKLASSSARLSHLVSYLYVAQ